jgi:hypothetical protein
MEPNKIEKQFREKLNAREIQPSAQAWDRLDAMLTVAEEKKTRKPFGFLFIAASILVFVTLGLFLFNQKDTVINNQNNVVETETKKDSTQTQIKNTQSPVIKTVVESEAVVSSEKKPTNNNNQVVSINNQEKINQKTDSHQNQIIKDKTIEFQNTSDVALKDLPRIVEQKENIVKRPIDLKSDEALLADLNKTTMKSTNSKSNIKVDAISLLSQVDGEVEQTFREKVFTKVNKNYKEVKVALANRNNQ